MLIEVDDAIPVWLLSRAIAVCGMQLRTNYKGVPVLGLSEATRVQLETFGDGVHQVTASIAGNVIADARQAASVSIQREKSAKN